jgi:hypothetical protein
VDKLEQYLDRVCGRVAGPRALRQHIRRELREHLLDAAAGHKAAGMSESEALDRALADFGGPDEVRSELEGAHGHRLMAVVIDKAMQWKERTMKARWLWATWAYIAVVGVIALELLFVAFASQTQVPKLQKLRADGWLDFEAAGADEPVLSWMFSVLRRLNWAWNELAGWALLAAAGAWGLFEWRVRSENKSLMRFAALGTIALGLAVVVVVTSASLVVPLVVGFPAMGKITKQSLEARAGALGTTVGELERAMARQDWDAMRGQADRAKREAEEWVKALDALPGSPTSGKPTREEMTAGAKSADESLSAVRSAVNDKDAARLAEALKKFHAAYDPVRPAQAR